MLGGLNAPLFMSLKSDYCHTKWMTDGWEWVDPLKEAKAFELAVDKNFMSISDVEASRGQDWEEILEQKEREQKKMKELGIDIAPAKKGKPNDDERDPENEADGEEDGIESREEK